MCRSSRRLEEALALPDSPNGQATSAASVEECADVAPDIVKAEALKLGLELSSCRELQAADMCTLLAVQVACAETCGRFECNATARAPLNVEFTRAQHDLALYAWCRRCEGDAQAYMRAGNHAHGRVVEEKAIC